MMYAPLPPPHHQQVIVQGHNAMTYPSPPQPMYVQPPPQHHHHQQTTKENSMPPPSQPMPISSPSSELDVKNDGTKRPNLRVQIPNESPEPSSYHPDQRAQQQQQQVPPPQQHSQQQVSIQFDKRLYILTRVQSDAVKSIHRICCWSTVCFTISICSKLAIAIYILPGILSTE